MGVSDYPYSINIDYWSTILDCFIGSMGIHGETAAGCTFFKGAEGGTARKHLGSSCAGKSPHFLWSFSWENDGKLGWEIHELNGGLVRKIIYSL